VNKHNWTLPYLAMGLACAAVALGGAPLNAAMLSQYSFVLSSGTSLSAAASTPSQPAGGLEERVVRMEHPLDGVTLVDMLSHLNELPQELQLIGGKLEVKRHNIGILQQHQRELHVDVSPHLSDLEVGKTAMVSAKNDDDGTPSPSNATPRLPNATSELPNATPRLPNAIPQLPNATPRLPNAIPQLPNAIPQLPNATPPASESNPQMPVFQPPLGVP
jgi:YbgF-like TolA binding protein